MKYFVLLFVITAFSAGYSQNYKQVKVYLDSHNDIEILHNAGLEFDHPHFTKDKAVEIFVSDDDYFKLLTTGLSFDVLIDDWFEYYNQRAVLTEAEKNAFIEDSKSNFNVEGFGFGSMGGFYTLNEVIQELDSMRLLYPNLITAKQQIGTSIEGRPIYLLKISDNPEVNEGEPEVLYTAIHHAREPQSMMQMIYFMYYLLENYNTNPVVQYLVNNRAMYFIPVLNPDGYEHNRSTNPNGGGMWRKNRRNNGSSFGVDLNRNYGPMAYWNAPNGGSSTSPSSDTYRGTAPFSEPETQTIRDFLASRNIKNALNYHTYSNLLIFPYGALQRETPDSVIFREFATDMTSYNGYVYGTDLQTVGYATRGNSDDYFYDGDTVLNSGKIFAMTPEVGSSSDGFWPSQSRIFPLAQENVLPNLYYAWVAGEYVSLVAPNFNQQYFNPGDVVELSPSFRNKGLSAANNINVELTSLSPHVNINNGTAQFPSIGARQTVTTPGPLSFSINSSAPIEERIRLLFTTRTGTTVMSTDTVSFITGIPTYLFVDTVNNPLVNWTVTATPTSSQKWEATTSTFYSSPASYTDSRVGNYTSNATVTMTLTNSVNLSTYNNPILTYWTKFDIESNWDYGQVRISTNNGTSWVPLAGAYTEPGVGSFQPNGQPVYDGTQSNWVREEISISNYNTNQVKLQFQLRTDGSVNRDGWYLDDIGILIYTAVPVELTSFSGSQFDKSVVLKWRTASELNNHGFEIERRIIGQGNKWASIGFVKGNGTTQSVSNYSFTDHNPSANKISYRLKQVDLDGTYRVYGPVTVEYTGLYEYELSQNYPNPFNPSTIINYSLEKAGPVEIRLYNVLGSEVATLVNTSKDAGKHSVELNADELGLTSGVYLYTIKSGSFVQTRKMVLMK